MEHTVDLSAASRAQVHHKLHNTLITTWKDYPHCHDGQLSACTRASWALSSEHAPC